MIRQWSFWLGIVSGLLVVLVVQHVWRGCGVPDSGMVDDFVKLYEAQRDSNAALERRFAAEREAYIAASEQAAVAVARLERDKQAIIKRLSRGTGILPTPTTIVDSAYHALWINAEERVDSLTRRVDYLTAALRNAKHEIAITRNSLASADIAVNSLGEELQRVRYKPLVKGFYAQAALGSKFSLDRLYADGGFGLGLQSGVIEVTIGPHMWVQGENVSFGGRAELTVWL
jgi:hypothetical protein